MTVDRTVFLLRDMGGEVVSADMFGGIFTTFQARNAGLTDYDLHAEALGLTHVRWPGGKLAKDGLDKTDWDGDGNTSEYVYSLSHDDVHLKAEGTNNPEFGLSGLLGYAIGKGQSASIIVPVDRYYDNIAAGQAELETFLERLVRGDFGAIPEDFTLELGNENISRGDVDGAFDYALTSDAFLGTISRFMSDPSRNPDNLDFKIAIQGGQDSETDAAIRSTISPQNYDAIDAVRYHYLNINIRDGQTKAQERAGFIAEWDAMLGRDVEIFATAWTVGDSRELTGTPLEWNDFGAAQGRTTIASMVQMVQNGVDKAAIWGVDTNLDRAINEPVNPNWFSTGPDGSVRLSHGGHAFQLMSESIKDKQIVYTNGNLAADGSLVNGHYPGLESVSTYVFEDANGLAIFLAANDISSGGETLRLNLSAFVGDATADVARITTRFNDRNNKYDDVAVRSDSTATIRNGILDVDFTQDYEMVRITIAYDGSEIVQGEVDRFNGTSDTDTFFVDNINDTINDRTAGDNDTVFASVNYNMYSRTTGVENLTLVGQAVNGSGNDLNNLIQGNDASNVLRGFDGKDTLHGEAGNDFISGNDGNDLITGGAGADRLFGDSGRDTIDGGTGNDTLAGEGADDSIDGGDGNDLITGQMGTDTLLGGNGQDTISGNFGNDFLDGGAGNDSLSGGTAPDTIWGGEGNDTLKGDQGADTLSGASGDDLLDGGSGVDTLSGGRGNDQLLGMQGADILYGNTGNDTLEGGTGDDRLFGSSGNDQLYGDQGVDTLSGGAGNDILRGGTLRDVFIFDSGADRIEDFNTREDVLQLDPSLWSGTKTGAQIVEDFGASNGGAFMLDFGDGNSVTFSGGVDLDALANTITFTDII